MIKYPEEVKNYILEHYQGIRHKELAAQLTELFGEKYGREFTAVQVNSYLKNRKLRNGLKNVYIEDYSRYIFSRDQAEYIKKHAAGNTTDELTRMLNQEFKTEYTVGQVRAYKKRKHIRSGIDTKFVKGCVSYNKGKHVKYAGCEKGYFRKGNMPHNTLPVGTLVERQDGFLQRKIGEPNQWIMEHRRVWEEANGSIPKGYLVMFLDGNKKNCSIDNLRLITQAENARLNQWNLRSSDPEVTNVGISIVKLKSAINERKKK